VDLVLAGRIRADFPALEPEPGLEILGEVADADLPALYSGAVAFLYPSLYEGFGLPVLEAMSCGAAVITSRDPALGELGADATMQLDAGDGRAWAEAMRSVLDNSDWRQGMGRRALSRSREYGWTATARRTHAVYMEARSRFGR
jgi:alpha-1,3-rhamnosyl/mannosyltransferase